MEYAEEIKKRCGLSDILLQETDSYFDDYILVYPERHKWIFRYFITS